MGQMIPYRSVAADGPTSAAVVASDNNSGTPFVPEQPSIGPGAPPPPMVADDGSCGCNTGCGPKCCGCGCGCGCSKADCDECPGIGVEVTTGVQCWRGIVDGEFQNNAGPIVSANLGVPVPGLRKYGIGAQVGFSYAAADLDGRVTNSTPPMCSSRCFSPPDCSAAPSTAPIGPRVSTWASPMTGWSTTPTANWPRARFSVSGAARSVTA